MRALRRFYEFLGARKAKSTYIFVYTLYSSRIYDWGFLFPIAEGSIIVASSELKEAEESRALS